MNYDITIVISSFNRDDKVGETVTRLFESDLSQFERVEVIIVDDGSPRPVADVVESIGKPSAKIDLRVIRHENSGIGATRNRGFRLAKSDIVLFLDDDILVKTSTLRHIFEALGEQPAGLIFGSYPFISHESESLARFACEFYGYDKVTDEPRFERVNAITSGLMCIDKRKLGLTGALYDDDMTIPAAEEYEVIHRFSMLNIPIFSARHISAIHNHHLELSWLAQQQYKYGLATAEAFAKCPSIIGIEHFAELKRKLNELSNPGVRSSVKRMIASVPVRKLILWMSKATNKLFPNRDHRTVFGLLTTSNYWGGYRDGLDRFGPQYEKN
ncbi:MAG: glycosyltransferase family 2 protein [bacterium]|nr:glycosyltransferase family 2 protein [bacterium]